MTGNELLAYVESQADASHSAWLDLVEPLENVSLLVPGNPDPAIAHADHGLPIFHQHANPDTAALWRELDGVVQKVGEHQRQPPGIGIHADGLRYLPLDAASGRKLPRLLAGAHDDIGQVDLLGAQQ